MNYRGKTKHKTDSRVKGAAGRITALLEKKFMKLRGENAKYRILFENAQNAIFWSDAETGIIINCNKAAEELLEKKRNLIIGRFYAILFPRPLARFYVESFKKQLRANKTIDMEVEMATRSGRRKTIHINVSIVRVNGKPVVQGILTDVSEQRDIVENLIEKARKETSINLWGLEKTNEGIKLLYRELEEKNRELRELDEMKSRFFSMISHELRTPLTSIQEGVEIVLDGSAGELNDDQKRFLDIAKRNIDRLYKIINDILDLKKLEAGKMKITPVLQDLNETLTEAAKINLLAARAKGLYLETRLEAELPHIKFDRDRILQVLANLLSNAVKFTESGGITLLSGKEGGDYLKVEVRDTGPGISEKDINGLFTDFSQVDTGNYRKPGSTGLGLAICREIIEKHGGRIWIESEVGRGSSFVFILPGNLV